MRVELRPYIGVAQAISKLLYPFAEVVIHNLNKNRIEAIFNPISRREVGDLSYLDHVDFRAYDESSLVIGPYEKLNYDGRKMKCIITVIRDDKSIVVGALCINLDVSVFDKYQALINMFLSDSDNQIAKDEQTLFKDTLYEKINSFVQKYCIDKNLLLGNLSRAQKKDLILELKSQGALDCKNASYYIARALGISRATVYNYLKLKF
ncbi:PAS domain-containing protein [Allofrancisella guangzhouensis]|uniref:DNA-binding protein n=1 Tax=Allofrancisella guangzhouensis TaxID=594679 RepID=A0A0A8E7R2_9GAMM|nr:PAS domain-containing protein [Allofrancisella guangzhouensis]AJC48186.1 hypothetical protein SD28_00165 [Allofrancisella guangzhouensis]MBK2027052.1 PAS domain-containing protein [Allofrancisella guangzhouensis]MBK2044542.1 PAS domain-containing protein [Allofrancisella guangzhouensis]MBK2046126.1 PAS domain-containing protein [Allofrancisella guangzhouensis]